VIGLVDSAGRLLHYYTPPTGCVNGKVAGGQAERRFVTWEDAIPSNVRDRVAGVRVRSVFTEGRDKFTWERITGIVTSAAEKAQEVAKLLKAAGVL